jgi:hypothetical protein
VLPSFEKGQKKGFFVFEIRTDSEASFEARHPSIWQETARTRTRPRSTSRVHMGRIFVNAITGEPIGTGSCELQSPKEFSILFFTDD